jgi:hypothetical protein
MDVLFQMRQGAQVGEDQFRVRAARLFAGQPPDQVQPGPPLRFPRNLAALHRRFPEGRCHRRHGRTAGFAAPRRG